MDQAGLLDTGFILIRPASLDPDLQISSGYDVGKNPDNADASLDLQLLLLCKKKRQPGVELLGWRRW